MIHVQEHGSQLFPGQGAAGAEEDTRQKTVEEGWIFGWEGRWDSSSVYTVAVSQLREMKGETRSS